MPGDSRWTAGYGRSHRQTAALDAYREKVDARAAEFERKLFEATTRDLRRDPGPAAKPAPRFDDLSVIDLTGDPDLDERGRF